MARLGREIESDGSGRLSTALELVSSVGASDLSGDDLAQAVLDAEQLLNAVHALSAALLERFEQDGGWAVDGAVSASAWTAARTGSARSSLHNRRRQGAALALLPRLGVRARRGRLSVEHLRAVATCVRRHPDLAAEDEALWIEQAEALGAERFGLATNHWLGAAADQAMPDRADPVPEARSHLHASRTLDGWLRLDGLLAPDDAHVVDAALDAGVDRALRAARDGDPSVEGEPVPVLRAGALVDLASQVMRRAPNDASVPDRYRVAVVVRAGRATEPAEAACDAAAYRVTLGAAGEVLNVGRQTARWPAAIRRAITVRDGGCTFPGCDRPPSWTDIHHCTPWAEGGETSVENGALLCRRHHSFVHRRCWRITIDNGRPIIRRPDGNPYVIVRWQPDAKAS